MIGFIVEGKSDVKKLKMVLKRNVHFVVLNGINFREEQINQISKAIDNCENVYVLTDPDEAGDKVANLITKVFPKLERLEVDPNEAKVLKKRGYKYGVEYCSNKYLKELFSTRIELTSLVF
ncbi:toprim domain-containing protein [Priestia aryabhattai]